MCKGDHWLRDCPVATEAQKADAFKRMTEGKERRALRRVTESKDTPAFRTAIVNGVMEVAFCPYTGADLNIIGSEVVRELRVFSSATTTLPVNPPIEVRVAGGTLVLCHEVVTIEVRITTAAGPVQLRGIGFFVLDGENELVLGRSTVRSASTWTGCSNSLPSG